MKEIIYLLSPIIATLSVIFSVAVFVYLKSSAPTFVKALLIPFSLALCLFIPIVFWTFVGVAKPVHSLPYKIQVLCHHVTVVEGKKDRIEIWYADGSRTKLVSIPYSKGLERALSEIAEARESGEMRALISGEAGGGEAGAQGEESSYKSEIIPPNHGLPPK